MTGRHLRAARALLGWLQSDVAKKAKVALGTIRRMEEANGPVVARTDNLNKVVAVFEKAGVDFLNDGQPGVRLRKP